MTTASSSEATVEPSSLDQSASSAVNQSSSSTSSDSGIENQSINSSATESNSDGWKEIPVDEFGKLEGESSDIPAHLSYDEFADDIAKLPNAFSKKSASLNIPTGKRSVIRIRILPGLDVVCYCTEESDGKYYLTYDERNEVFISESEYNLTEDRDGVASTLKIMENSDTEIPKMYADYAIRVMKLIYGDWYPDFPAAAKTSIETYVSSLYQFSSDKDKVSSGELCYYLSNSHYIGKYSEAGDSTGIVIS
jgi:hypothetical protein